MTAGRSDLIDIAGEVLAETAKAVLLYDGARQDWLPKSQIEIDRRADGTVEVAMPEWLAKAKGFI
ncbi:MAG: hypothetical protein ACE5GS_17625 [Kiloniellaceae bacterium]